MKIVDNQPVKQKTFEDLKPGDVFSWANDILLKITANSFFNFNINSAVCGSGGDGRLSVTTFPDAVLYPHGPPPVPDHPPTDSPEALAVIEAIRAYRDLNNSTTVGHVFDVLDKYDAAKKEKQK